MKDEQSAIPPQSVQNDPLHKLYLSVAKRCGDYENTEEERYRIAELEKQEQVRLQEKKAQKEAKRQQRVLDSVLADLTETS